jgi:CHAD domain-containing protein
MDYLDQLQDEIGKWHDAVLAFDLFSEEEQNDKAALMKLQGEIKNKESSVISLSYNSCLKLLKSPGYENTSSTTEKNSNQLQETHL